MAGVPNSGFSGHHQQPPYPPPPGHAYGPGYGPHPYGYGYDAWWRVGPLASGHACGCYGGVVACMFGVFFLISGLSMMAAGASSSSGSGDSNPFSTIGPVFLTLGCIALISGIALACVFGKKLKTRFCEAQRNFGTTAGPNTTTATAASEHPTEDARIPYEYRQQPSAPQIPDASADPPDYSQAVKY